MTSINGKYVLLTGGSRGIGPIIAETLAKQGAHIALAARSEDGLRNVVESLKIFGVQTLIVSVDLAQPLQCQELVSTVMDKFGTIDILINNAGLETEGGYIRLPWEAIRETIEVNLVAPMYLTHLVLPHMLDKKSGHIVNIASVGAKCGAPYAATYCATKAGLAEWSQALHLELADTGVQFSTIFPGYITEVGMFAKFGLTAPRSIGSCTPAQVANAVIKAIEHNTLDVIVNSLPNRLLFALRELSPSLGDWLLYKLGVVDFQRKKVGL
ncbi:MAG: SDR family NAD(P)-dependent oxidoreductase [Planctomycetota bacterium]